MKAEHKVFKLTVAETLVTKPVEVSKPLVINSLPRFLYQQ